MMIAVPRNPLQWKALLIRVSAATAASVAESGPLEAPQEVRQDSQGDFGAEKKRVKMLNIVPETFVYRDRRQDVALEMERN